MGIQNCRVDASVDSRALIGAWEGKGSRRSPQLTRVKKHPFFALSSPNIQLNLRCLPSHETKQMRLLDSCHALILNYQLRRLQQWITLLEDMQVTPLI